MMNADLLHLCYYFIHSYFQNGCGVIGFINCGITYNKSNNKIAIIITIYTGLFQSQTFFPSNIPNGIILKRARVILTITPGYENY